MVVSAGGWWAVVPRGAVGLGLDTRPLQSGEVPRGGDTATDKLSDKVARDN